MRREQFSGFLVGVWLVGVGLLGQLIYHWPNFAPVAAAALFAGFYFRSRWAAAAVPLATLLFSDVLIGPIAQTVQALLGPASASWINTAWATSYEPRVMAVVVLALSLPALWGAWLRTPLSTRIARRLPFRSLIHVGRFAGCALFSSAVFFLASNFAVWYFGGEGWYPKTPAGLIACYAAALPFFKYTVAGDLFYSGLFFGAYAVVHALAVRRVPWAVGELPPRTENA